MNILRFNSIIWPLIASMWAVYYLTGITEEHSLVKDICAWGVVVGGAVIGFGNIIEWMIKGD